METTLSSVMRRVFEHRLHGFNELHSIMNYEL